MKLLSVESTDSFPGGHGGEDPARFPRRAATFSLTEAFVQATDRWQDTAGSSCPQGRPRGDHSHFLDVSLLASESPAGLTEPRACQNSPPVKDAICLSKNGGGARPSMAPFAPPGGRSEEDGVLRAQTYGHRTSVRLFPTPPSLFGGPAAFLAGVIKQT